MQHTFDPIEVSMGEQDSPTIHSSVKKSNQEN